MCSMQWFHLINWHLPFWTDTYEIILPGCSYLPIMISLYQDTSMLKQSCSITSNFNVIYCVYLALVLGHALVVFAPEKYFIYVSSSTESKLWNCGWNRKKVNLQHRTFVNSSSWKAKQKIRRKWSGTEAKRITCLTFKCSANGDYQIL